jgi:hypothetical protein
MSGAKSAEEQTVEGRREEVRLLISIIERKGSFVSAAASLVQQPAMQT